MLSTFLWSQSNEISLNFQKLRVENGLSDNSYNHFIYQDSKGFTWISSINGLNRFDGFEVKKYREESGMLGNNIQSNFYEDHNSDIWFSTYQGLNCYRRDLDSIDYYLLKSPDGELLSTDYKVFHLEKNQRRLWLKAGSYIFHLDIENPDEYTVLERKTYGNQFSVTTGLKGDVNKILASPNIISDSIGLFYINDGLLSKYLRYLPNDIRSLKKSYPLENDKWLFLHNKEMFVFTENGINAEILPLNNTIDATFRDAVKINQHQFIISTKEKGLWLYDWKSDAFLQQWESESNKNYSLSSNSTRELNFVQDNILWVSHRNIGLDYALMLAKRFYDPMKQTKLASSEIVSITEDSNQHIWIATKFNGLLQFSQEGKLIKHFENKGFNPNKSEVWQLQIGGNGTLFCTNNDNIYYLDKEKQEFVPIPNPDNFHFRCLSSAYPNRTLVSTTDGIKEIVKDKNQFNLQDCKELASHASFSFMQIFQSSDRKIYLPYNANELWIFSAERDGLKEINKLKCNLEFFGFCKSKKYPNVVWAGTSRGLVKIVQDSIIVPFLEGNSEVESGNVYGIVEDENGLLWLTTNSGLYQYDLEYESIHKYDELKGLSSNTFSLYNSSLMASNGQIWFGGSKGLVHFDPLKINPISIPPKVFVESLIINKNEVIKGINELDHLTLPYHQNNFTFLAKGIGYIKPKDTKIYHRLIGYDDDWFHVQNGQHFRYSKLPHGKYTLEIKAIDVNKNESITKSFKVQIHPPFWKTWWAYTISTLFLLGLIYLLYWLRVRQIKKTEEKKTALMKLNLQILEGEMKALRAQMNPHFLFNTMNSIKGIIVKKEEKKAAVYLTKFSTLLRAILSNSEKQKIVLKKELEALKLYIDLESLRFTDTFSYSIQIDESLDTSFIRVPPLLLQPFVENAIWHGLIPKTKGSKVLSVHIFRRKDFLVFEIEDNGIGRKEAGKNKKQRNHKSMGLEITQKRINLLSQKNEIEIEDLFDNNENALGTKVSIKLFLPE